MKYIPESARDIWPYDARNPFDLAAVGGLEFSPAARILHTVKGRGEVQIVVQVGEDRIMLTVDWEQSIRVASATQEANQ